MKAVFIVNPIAGEGKAKSAAEMIKKLMEKRNADYEIWETKEPLHAKQLAAKAVQQNFNVVCSVGGDGTACEIANALVGTSTALAVLPMGSGNDIAKSLTVPKELNKMLDKIFENKPRYIDLIDMNGFLCIDIASVGLDAEVVNSTLSLRDKKLGRFVYLVALLKTLSYFKSVKMEISIDGRKYDGDYLLVSVANGKFYGGGFKIAPFAEINDGLMDICLVRKVPSWFIAVFFPLVILGKHQILKEVTLLKGKDVELSFKGERLVNIDGNLYKKNCKKGKGLHFKIKPASILSIF